MANNRMQLNPLDIHNHLTVKVHKIMVHKYQI